MKIEAIFDNLGQRIVLTPTTERESLLLGGALAGAIECEVLVDYEGHFSHGKAKLVQVVLRSAAGEQA